jgi:hypothetical protein
MQTVVLKARKYVDAFLATFLAALLACPAGLVAQQPRKGTNARRANRQVNGAAGVRERSPGLPLGMLPGPIPGGLPGSHPTALFRQPDLRTSLLVLDPAVARDLGLTAEQSTSLRKLVDRLNQDLERALKLLSERSDGPVALNEAAELIERNRREADLRVTAQISPDKASRLKQIQRQLAGVSALVASPQADGLGLSAEQRSRFQKSLDEVDRQVDVFRRRKEREALEGVLSPEQKVRLADQLGEPVKFSLALPWVPSFRPTPVPPGAQGMAHFASPSPLPPADEPRDLDPIDSTP